jgi:hypothetical protein
MTTPRGAKMALSCSAISSTIAPRALMSCSSFAERPATTSRIDARICGCSSVCSHCGPTVWWCERRARRAAPERAQQRRAAVKMTRRG